MKKKLNLFCLLIFAVIVCDVLSMSNVFIAGFSSGMRHGAEKRNITETNPCNYCYISLVPEEMSQATAQTITDKAGGKEQQAWPTQLIVPTGERMGVFAAIFKLVYTLAFGVLALAALVAFVCFVCLLSWMCQSWLMAIFYSLLLFLLYTVLSRILCESGIPFLAPAWQPTNMLLYLLGPAAIGPHALTFFCWAGNGIFTPDPRESLIGYVANGVKLADDNRLNLKKIFVWICGIAILALIIGWFAAFWSTYNYSPMNDGYAAGSPPRAELNQAARFFSDMKAANTFETSLATNPVERLGMIAGSSLQQHFFLYGFLAVLAVSLLRFRFAGFPIHPILFLIWGSYPSNCAWASFLIGWFIKQLVVRFGGGGVYQKCKPLFVGLIAGEILLIGITIAMDFAYYLATGSQSPVRIWFMPG